MRQFNGVCLLFVAVLSDLFLRLRRLGGSRMGLQLRSGVFVHSGQHGFVCGFVRTVLRMRHILLFDGLLYDVQLLYLELLFFFPLQFRNLRICRLHWFVDTQGSTG